MRAQTRAVAGPPPITEESTWAAHRECEMTWVAPGQPDEHAVCLEHRVRFDLPTEDEVRDL